MKPLRTEYFEQTKFTEYLPLAVQFTIKYFRINRITTKKPESWTLTAKSLNIFRPAPLIFSCKASSF